MSLFVLTCPHCEYSKELPKSILPPAGTRTACPRCKGSFTLSHDSLREVGGPSPVSSPSIAPSPASPAVASPSPASPSGASPSQSETSAIDAPEPQPLHRQQPPSSPPRQRPLAFTFSGTAKEYFGIWIVNALLRIITLGLYSPWAKVRKRRFFYGNTQLNGSSFDYLADPLAILKGWLIGVAAFGAYSLASNTNPIAAAVIMVLFMGLFPWVVVRSHIFNMRNSSHRNVRFGFNADYREAYRVFLWWQLLIPLTLGIITPYVLYRQKRFLVENSLYGTTPFSFHATSKDYFRIFRPVFLLALLGAVSIGGMVFLYWGKSGTYSTTSFVEAAPALALAATYFAAVFAIVVYLPIAQANLTWSSTGIGNHRFSLTLRIRDLIWIHFSNSVAVTLSLGLLMPWASIRMARYTLGKLTLQGTGDLDYITAAATAPTGATGEELGDVFGLDFGL